MKIQTLTGMNKKQKKLESVSCLIDNLKAVFKGYINLHLYK